MSIRARAGKRTVELVEKGEQVGIVRTAQGDRPVCRDVTQLACCLRGMQHEGKRAGPEHLGQTTGIGRSAVHKHVKRGNVMHEPGKNLIGGALLELEDAGVSRRTGKRREAIDGIGRDDDDLSVTQRVGERLSDGLERDLGDLLAAHADFADDDLAADVPDNVTLCQVEQFEHGLDEMAALLPGYMRMVAEGERDFCGALCETTAAEAAAVVLLPALMCVFGALLGVVANLRFPKFDYINETAVVKNSASVVIAMFGSWAVLAAPAILYFVLPDGLVGLTAYLYICAAALAALRAEWGFADPDADTTEAAKADEGVL